METTKRKYVKKGKKIEITPIKLSDFNKDLKFLTSGKFQEKKEAKP